MPLEFNEDRHEYRLDGVIIPSVTTILSEVGLYDFDYVSRETLDVAAERGRLVHRMIEWHELDILDDSTIDPELQGYFDGYLAARREALPKPEAVEVRFACKRFGYAGTIDAIIDNGAWYNDIKTGQPSPEHGLQLSGYWLGNHGGDMLIQPGRLTGTYLDRAGSYRIIDYPYEPMIFLAIVTEHKWRTAKNKIKRKF